MFTILLRELSSVMLIGQLTLYTLILEAKARCCAINPFSIAPFYYTLAIFYRIAYLNDELILIFCCIGNKVHKDNIEKKFNEMMV